MNVDYEKLMQMLRKKQYAPVYCIDGEETFYLDKVTDYFENNILPTSEKDFNLIVLYGKETEWKDLKNALMRYPMFAERQVVVLRDADQYKGGEDELKGLNSLLNYLDHPSPTTVFLIEHPKKKVDGKTKFGKAIKDKSVYLTTEKLKDEKVPAWIQEYGQDINFKIGEQEAQLLTQSLGNDLQKIANEIDKIRINVPHEKELSLILIHKYIGISREYNIYDFPKALTSGDYDKLFKMLSYFVANPKSAPMPLVIGAFYPHFSQLYFANFAKGMDEKAAATLVGIKNPYFLKGIFATTQQWHIRRVEKALLILAKYSTMAVGIKNSTNDDREILKEMIGQFLMV